MEQSTVSSMKADPNVIKRIIDRAAEILSSKESWIQGDYHNAARDAHCLQGALFVAEDDIGTNLLAREGATKVVECAIARKLHRAKKGVSIVGYNDAKGRKFKDIKDVLKVARKIAKKACDK